MKVLFIAIGIIIAAALLAALRVFFGLGHPGNAAPYALRRQPRQENSPLRGKTILCLGSSISSGFSSGGVSFLDYLGRIDGCCIIQETVSATTLADRGHYSYLKRLRRRMARMGQPPDYFICQLSTNDATFRSVPGKISRSRRPEDIEHEVRGIAEAGYKEIVLTGIHLSSYGVDFKDEQQENLLTLIKRLDQIPGIERLRLGSLEQRIVTREFAKELARLRTICPHFHLSLQSGCDATLKRMNRRYNAAEYQACCEILREEFDNPAITSDVIVGFPGETEEEFAETERFLKAIHFYEMHIFKYSRRAGTRAADMPDQVPEGTKSVRSDILLALEKQQSLEYRGRFLGTEEEILLEEPIEIDGTKYMMGHTRQYVKGAVPYEEGLKNKTVKGIFTKALNEEVLLLEKE